MSGTPVTMTKQPLSAKEKSGLQRLNSALEKLHLAEAEVARARGDLARKGVRLDISESMHW
ncbi:MAG: hypothetical protein ACK4UO_05625 [Pseudolabrys sp.]